MVRRDPRWQAPRYGGGDNRFTQEMESMLCYMLLRILAKALSMEHQDDSAVVRFVLVLFVFLNDKFLFSLMRVCNRGKQATDFSSNSHQQPTLTTY